MENKDHPDGQKPGAAAHARDSRGAEEILKQRLMERLNRINRCFTECILPEIFSVEEDLNQKEFWNKIDIRHDTTLESGKPNIKEVVFCFIPEKVDKNTPEDRLEKRAYRTEFTPTRNFHKIRFSMVFPARLSDREEDDAVFDVEQIRKKSVDDFLERFVKGAVSAYSSDHILM